MDKSQQLNIKRISIAIATSLLTSGLIIGLRTTGFFEQGELLTYDYLVRSNAQKDPDSRILLVAVDDSSLQKLNSDKVSDGNLAKAIKNLQQHQPKVISIDILRDIPIGEGREELISYTNNLYEPLEGQIKPIIFPCALPSQGRQAGIAPPPIIDVDSAVGFVNLDADKVNLLGSETVRRMPISSIPVAESASSKSPNSSAFATTEEPLCSSPFSLGFLTALSYLQSENIFIDTAEIINGNIGLGETNFTTLKSNAGGYQKLDTGVYQTILDYHHQQPAEVISLAQVLDNKINSKQVKDKVVLIGYTTKNDIHQTPFGTKPGVLIHGWTVSQILSNVLDERPQVWYWSESIEWLWISAWGVIGGLIAWKFRPAWQVSMGGGIASIVLLGSSAFLFTQQGWIPIIPSVFNLAIATTLAKIILPKSQTKLTESQISEFQGSHYSPQATFVESNQSNTSPSPQPTVVESSQPNTSPSPQPTFVESNQSNTSPSPQPTFVESNTVDQSVSQSTVVESDTVDQSLSQSTVEECDTSRSTYTRQDLLVGKIIASRYRLDNILGKGGMSKVYLASDTRLENKTVAIKIMTSYSGNNNQALIKRFNREVRVISSLRSHNIVQVTDFGLTPPEHPFMGSPFYVMEYFQGKTLGEVLHESPFLSVNRTIRIMLQVCTGLKEAHKKGIIHRDLKPDNIFLATGGVFGEEAKILDFGIAKVVETEDKKQTEMTQHGSFIGTYRYASPEQCKGIPTIDRQTDIYSLGIILYEMLSGKNPYNSDVSQTTQGEWIACHIRAEAQRLSTYEECKDVPDSLKQITMKCLKKSPSERFQSIEELTQALKEVNPSLF